MTYSTQVQELANQRVFTEAWNHVIAQGEPSLAADGHNCAYRSDAGLGCALAPAIQTYDEKMETLGAAELFEQFPDKVHAWAAEVNEHLANSVQAAHDNSVVVAPGTAFLPEFKAVMRLVAAEYNLVVPS